MKRPRTMQSRRSFIEQGVLYLAGAACGGAWLSREASAREGPEPVVRAGLITDIHHANKDTAGTRNYRSSISKVRRAINRLRELEVDFLVELGDYIDVAPSLETEITYLQEIDSVYRSFPGPRHYVLGNHCVSTLTKEEFLAHTGAVNNYYSFDSGGVHFIVLDACFRADGVPYGRKNFTWTDTEIPPRERAWLEEDLARTTRRTLAFVHQRLDLDPPSHYLVKSAEEVRKILEASGKVQAVFQGHNHLNDLRSINGIHYCTLPAVVEGLEKKNAFALLEIFPDGSLRLTGFGETSSHTPGRLGRPRRY